MINLWHKAAPTADGISHGLCLFQDCLNAVIEKYEDGYMFCAILWSGGSCEECYQMFEEQSEKQ